MRALYVNGQDISRLILGLCVRSEAGVWSFRQVPETFSVAPEAFLATIAAYLNKQGVLLEDVQAFLLVAGPGSATALRTTHALINTLAFAQKKVIYSIKKEIMVADEDVFNHEVVQAVKVAIPQYAHEVKITPATRDALRRSF